MSRLTRVHELAGCLVLVLLPARLLRRLVVPRSVCPSVILAAPKRALLRLVCLHSLMITYRPPEGSVAPSFARGVSSAGSNARARSAALQLMAASPPQYCCLTGPGASRTAAQALKIATFYTCPESAASRNGCAGLAEGNSE